jgi:hypothetical protein
MNTFFGNRIRLALVAVAVVLAYGPALAEKPSWAGDGRNDARDGERYANRRDDRRQEDRYRENRREDRRADRRDDRRDMSHDNERRRDEYWGAREHRFHDDFRARVNVYYGEQFRRGHCPPGLARKHNGCVPPGHARRWEQGRSLPRDVVYAPLPRELLIQLPPPPLDHKYVRVASDVLLISVGTAIVVDAIEDIGR